jgi:hypothetical protein
MPSPGGSEGRCHGKTDDVIASVLWLHIFTSSTSDLGDGGASSDHKHQQQCTTVPLALQGAE